MIDRRIEDHKIEDKVDKENKLETIGAECCFLPLAD